MDHQKREHALLSASGASRWLTCTPSARLEEQFPDSSSESAKEGTLAHELAEAKVRHFCFAPDFTKRKLTYAIKKMKENELWDDEMMGYTDEYLEYIKSVSLSLKNAPSVRIEDRVHFKEYTFADPDDEIEGSGIADCILLYGDTAHIIDFKYGKSPMGRVSAEKNSQLMLYALGAYQSYRMLYNIKNIKIAIVQPRLPDGISEWGCTIEELLAFGEYVKERAALAVKGEGAFCPSASTCGFCRARAQCRARSERNVNLAFPTGELPPLITNAEVGERLSAMADVVKYQKDLHEYALKESLAGKKVPGWKAVEGRRDRDWTNMDEVFDVLTKDGIVPRGMLWEQKPLTLAQIEKMLGTKEFQDSVGKYVIRKRGKPALVKETDKREAITNKTTAAEAFKEGAPSE